MAHGRSPGEERRALVRNEQAKLTATYLNNLAIAVFAIGGITPLASSFVGQGGLAGFTLAVGGVCFVISVGLHLGAQLILRRLRP